MCHNKCINTLNNCKLIYKLIKNKIMSLNKVLLIGHVGKDPEIITFDNGSKIAIFSLATSENYKNKQGEKVTNTEWHNIVFGPDKADIIEKYVKKGTHLYIEGSIKTRIYDAKDGTKRYLTEIKAYKFDFLGSKQSDQSNNVNNEDQNNNQSEMNETDDLPF